MRTTIPNDIGYLFGREIGQSWNDLETWEFVLNVFDKIYDNHIKWILEVGTWQGGMSFYLSQQAYAREKIFLTIDKERPLKPVPCFLQWNINDGLPAFRYFNDNPGIVFCDNGDKPKEVNIVKDLIHRESIIAVHDLTIEFNERDIPPEYRRFHSNANTIFLARNDFLNKLEAEGFFIST